MRRAGRDERWNDLAQVIADVGERPSDKHMLRRRDASQPWGRDNWYWMEPISADGIGDGRREARNAYMRAWTKKNRLRAKNSDLKEAYGIGIVEYDQMLADQDGKCAICGRAEIRIINGRPVALAVDHSHQEHGKVRGLLCMDCNRGLGLLRDDPELLDKAAAYLRHHAA